MLLFGALFSLLSNPCRPASIFTEGAFWHGFVFTSIFNVAVVYSAIHYPDWMWMYFLEDSSNTVGELLFLFGFLYYLPYALGYYIGRDFKRISVVGVYLVMAFLAVIEAWMILKLFDRYSRIGTLEEFRSGTAVSLFGPDNPIGLVMNGSIVVMVLYFVFVIYLYRKKKALS